MLYERLALHKQFSVIIYGYKTWALRKQNRKSTDAIEHSLVWW